MSENNKTLEMAVGVVVGYACVFLVGLGVHTLGFGDPATGELIFALSWQSVIYTLIVFFIIGQFFPKEETSGEEPSSDPEKVSREIYETGKDIMKSDPRYILDPVVKSVKGTVYDTSKMDLILRKWSDKPYCEGIYFFIDCLFRDSASGLIIAVRYKPEYASNNSSRTGHANVVEYQINPDEDWVLDRFGFQGMDVMTDPNPRTIRQVTEYDETVVDIGERMGAAQRPIGRGGDHLSSRERVQRKKETRRYPFIFILGLAVAGGGLWLASLMGHENPLTPFVGFGVLLVGFMIMFHAFMGGQKGFEAASHATWYDGY